MKILGIDPGIGRLGYGVAEIQNKSCACIAVGCLTSPSTQNQSARLLKLSSELIDLIRLYKPGGAVVEKIYFSKNTRTAMTIAEARGMILLTLEKNHIPIIELSPQHVKMGVTGNGAATKEQVQRMVQTLYNLKNIPKPDDAADALALAFAGLSYFRHHKV
jgi:crossover junction endodeoxyribonuclease RuvC